MAEAPSELDEVSSLTPAMPDRLRSSGAATVAEKATGATPGALQWRVDAVSLS